jgi:uncharacterized protein
MPTRPLRRILLVFVSLLAALSATPARADDPVATSAPAVAPLSAADIGFDVRIDLAVDEKGADVAFALIEKEFARDPRPHVQARYAEFLIQGPLWHAPDGQAARGLQLAREALDRGSVYARRVVGWELCTGRHGPADRPLGLTYLRQAADAGVPEAMLSLSEVHLRGIGVAVDLAAAEDWAVRAARQGQLTALVKLARHYERLSPPNREKAGELYYEAAIDGDGPALELLWKRYEAKDPVGSRACQLVILSYASLGRTFPTKRVLIAIKELEAKYPQDPLVLYRIGLAYMTGERGVWNLEKAQDFLARASALGSDDARAAQAKLLAEGGGVKKDKAKAVAIWRELAARGNARALSSLGYYHYWGSLGAEYLPKDAALSFSFDKQAADLGDAYGQHNLGLCYRDGVGTAVDYALAAKYFRMAAHRGHGHSREQLAKLLLFVPH